MSLIRYYSALLRHNEEMAPTLTEAQQDFRRAADLTQVAFGFFAF